uniref:Rhodanese domain-containing protein n=1 Tax=Rhodosorus marinus TaxID=101924 RepID=A0A7S2ZEL8_9RHOD|mmetsp:Transcript_16869/g.68904  ORF Transcript_16869/g.68904 Transcript_16869/m.68904 type:complete len:338 (+) Transcript_16869:763-1776(+)
MFDCDAVDSERRAASMALKADVNGRALVSAAWLNENRSSVGVVDSTWHLPTEKRDAAKDHRTRRIPGSIFLDIDKVANLETDLPHMLPSAEFFRESLQALRINVGRPVVFYSANGFVGSARAWWTFRAFGLEDVYVLDGGLQAWIDSGFPLDVTEARACQSLGYSDETSATAFLKLNVPTPVIYAAQDQAEPGAETEVPTVRLRESFVRSFDDIIRNIDTQKELLVDARSPAGRFDGSVPEPRAGVPSGHAPGSLSLPFTDLYQDKNGRMKELADLRKLVEDLGIDLKSTKPIVTSCGTGVTCAITSLALFELGVNSSIYDGSWLDYVARDGPIVRS